MALKQGKKQVGLQSGNISASPFPTTTITAQIAKPISEIVDTFQKKAETDARIGWQSDFNQKTRDYYLQLQEKFEFDPEGMKNSIDTYSKTLLKKTPNAYKEYAQNVLAQKNLHNLSYATSNYNKFQDTKAENDYQIDRINLETDVNNFYNIVSNDDTLGIKDINLYFDEKIIPNLNQLFGSNQERLVDTKRKTENELERDISKDIQKLETIRIYNIAINKDSIESIEYMNAYSQGNDLHSIKTKNVNDPIFQKYTNEINDPFVKDKIINDAKNLLKTYRGQKLKDLAKQDKFKLSEYTELGGALHFSKFSNSQNTNPEKYITENFPNVSAADSMIIKKHINEVYETQNNVVKMKKGEILIGLNKAEKNDAFKQLLSESGINEDPSKILKVDDPNFNLVKTTFEKQQSIPESWETYVNKPVGDVSENPEVLEAFKKQLEFFQQIKGEYAGFHTNVKTSGYMFHASQNNLLSLSNAEIVADYKKWNARDKKSISESVDSQINEDSATFKVSINNALDGQNSIFSLLNPFRPSVSKDLNLLSVLGDGNKFSKVLYPDSWTALAYEPYHLMEDGIKVDFETLVAQELKFIATDSSVDIKDTKTINLAVFSALNKALKKNITPSQFTEKKGYRLTRHGIENEFNLSDTAIVFSVLPTMDAWWATLSQSEKDAGVFGQDQTGANIKYEDIQARMKDGDLLPAFKPSGQMNGGKMSYSVSIPNGNGRFVKITLPEENFQPDGWENIKPKWGDAPSNKAEVVKLLADNNYTFMEKLLGDFDTTENTAKYYLRKFAKGSKEGVVNLANFSWMMDVPIADDVPNEIKPFKMLFNLLGVNVEDLDDKMSEIAIHNKKQADLMSYMEKMNRNKLMSDKSKQLESLYPPHKQVHGSYRAGMTYQHFAYTNYNNTELALTHRTNNFLGIEKNTNDNSLDITAENNTAVFAHPKDSIKAAIIKMINMSTIVPGGKTDVLEGFKILKQFGDTPSVEELLTKFNPKDKTLYLNALKNSKLIPEDIVNFQDTNQMAAIIKFMSRVKMGTQSQPIVGDSSVFDKYYKNNIMVDIYINEGVTEAFNTYAGIIGKN